MSERDWRKWRIGTLIIVVLIGLLALLYDLLGRYLQPFDQQGLYPEQMVGSPPFVAFINQHLSQYQDEHQLLILHWLNPECFCSVYSGTTVDSLSKLDSSLKIKHLVLTPPDKAQALLNLLPILKQAQVIALSPEAYRQSQRLIPSSPAVLIYNRQAQSVSYLGPHSSGVVCGKGTGFVELVVNNLEHGFDPLLYELEQSGCFCPW